jgi:hypothetical protein
VADTNRTFRTFELETDDRLAEKGISGLPQQQCAYFTPAKVVFGASATGRRLATFGPMRIRLMRHHLGHGKANTRGEGSGSKAARPADNAPATRGTCKTGRPPWQGRRHLAQRRARSFCADRSRADGTHGSAQSACGEPVGSVANPLEVKVRLGLPRAVRA